MADVYVATKAENYEIARLFMAALETAGHDITYNWTDMVESLGGNPPDEGVAAEQAAHDKRGVETCDVFVLIAHEGLVGTLIEYGIALAAGVPIVLVGEPRQQSIFWKLPNVKAFYDDDLRSISKVVAWVDAWHAERHDPM